MSGKRRRRGWDALAVLAAAVAAGAVGCATPLAVTGVRPSAPPVRLDPFKSAVATIEVDDLRPE
jgi:hypothetical protein